MNRTTTSAALSLIVGLHARYEANQIEIAQIEDADTNEGRAHVAFEESELEFDALRIAILTQVPDSRAEAAILQYHIRVEHDWQATVVDRGAIGKRGSVLSLALDTLFDFIASEADIPHTMVGPAFIRAAEVAHRARRARTGDMI